MSGQRKSTRRMKQLTLEFFDEGRRLSESDDSHEKASSHCWLCGMAVDYTVPANSTPDSHNLDHYYPVRDYPELQHDPANFRHSHAECNVARGADAPLPNLGMLSRTW
ncbi:hypothetical protein [Microbacterium sp. 2FI]|uniref:hypothetical protein n=1 Tax=Microbacterium sp. 2FI TaxID=2502193 RepID=UPI0010F55462|nr:hypothetical protein [Microbacterium sp. 2FI]